MNQKLNPSPMTAKQWYEAEFLPWQAKASAYRAEKANQREILMRHLPALQTMVGLLLEGQTKRAVLAWNALGLEPALAEIIIGKNGDEILLRSKGGKAEHLTLDEVIAGLEALTRATEVPTAEAPQKTKPNDAKTA
jgi:predicted RNase H-like nuclease (RuvC/YqgF family)